MSGVWQPRRVELDSSPPWSLERPAIHYVICATPRSGSGLLARGLASTGLAGTPAEYFNANQRVPLGARWAAGDTVHGYALALRRFRTAANGVLGVKLHRDQLTALAGELAGTPVQDDDGTRAAGALRTLLGDVRLVHIRRRDVDRQAVSYLRAMHTGVWHLREGETPQPSGPEPAYDFAELERLRTWLAGQDAAWEGVFAALGAEPARVVYEDFVADHEPTLRRVLASVFGPLGDVAIGPADGVRQADARTEAFVARYTAERAAAAHPV